MRRVLFFASLFAACLASSPSAFAQHAGDVEFKYDSGQIVLRNGEPGFLDGHRVFEAEFQVGGIFDGFSDEPGFISEIDVGLGIGADDVIGYNILSSPSHGQFLHFWDPTLNLGLGGLGSLGSNIRIRTQDALAGEL